MAFSSRLVVLLAVVCFAYAKSASDHKKDEKRVDGDVRVFTTSNVLSFSSYPFMASVQKAPGRCSKGANAVFIQEHWVLTCTSLIESITSRLNPKKVVVITGTLSPYNDGDTFRVKEIISHQASGLSLLKISNEIETYTNLVKSDFVVGACDSLAMLRWDTYGENLKFTDNINLDAGVCATGFFCVPFIPLTGSMDKCAVVINDDLDIAGMVDTISGGSGVEKVIDLAIYSNDLNKIVNDN